MGRFSRPLTWSRWWRFPSHRQLVICHIGAAAPPSIGSLRSACVHPPESSEKCGKRRRSGLHWLLAYSHVVSCFAEQRSYQRNMRKSTQPSGSFRSEALDSHSLKSTSIPATAIPVFFSRKELVSGILQLLLRIRPSCYLCRVMFPPYTLQCAMRLSPFSHPKGSPRAGDANFRNVYQSPNLVASLND